jgi:hypothetical protein
MHARGIVEVEAAQVQLLEEYPAQEDVLLLCWQRPEIGPGLSGGVVIETVGLEPSRERSIVLLHNLAIVAHAG